MNEEFELIAKHCPKCESLIMAKIEKTQSGNMRYRDYICSNCSWTSPEKNH